MLSSTASWGRATQGVMGLLRETARNETSLFCLLPGKGGIVKDLEGTFDRK